MSETKFVPYPTSKITSLNILHEREGYGYAICEDGSVWEFLAASQYGKGFKLLFAPPSQPTQSGQSDLDEALHALRNVIDNLEVPWGKTHEYAVNLRNAAFEILRKHGA